MRAQSVIPLLLAILAGPVAAVEVRIATFNLRLGIGGKGDPGRTNAEAVLRRIDADIVALQEITIDDLRSGDFTDFAGSLGYPHRFVPVAALDSFSRVAILSRFPFVPGSTTSIISPSGANDVTRAAAAAIVDVPGISEDPVIVNAHLKCCFDNDDPFRRAIEMIRIRQFLEDSQLGPDDNVFIMGDFNLLGNQTLTFSRLPSGLPPSFSLGNDITFDVTYFTTPLSYFPGIGLTNPGYRHQNGITTDTFAGSQAILDFLLVSSAVAGRRPVTEIYNSSLEGSFPGLPKSGAALAPFTSSSASDHFPLFGDFRLEDALPLSLSSSTSRLVEGSRAATLTVSLESPADAPTKVDLGLDDNGEATLAKSEILIPAGQTTASTTITALNDKISDGDQEITVTASAADRSSAALGLTIADSDPVLYRFGDANTPIIEDFSGFPGTQNPAAWSVEDLSWQGEDDGSGTRLGGRSYNGSLGIYTASPTRLRTKIRNESEETIDALEIAYSGIHWRRSSEGAPDQIHVSVIREGEETPLPELTFAPSISGESGQLNPPGEKTFATYLRGLRLEPGDEIDLAFQVTPGRPSNASSNDVFINEFHYDNIGSDTGEFIEVYVGEGFSSPLSDISIQLYNGLTGSPYGSIHSVATFVGSGDTSGPRLFHKRIAGIQNGSPDGIALVVNGQVREFISYEGAFTAVTGIASGLVSSPIGVSQNGVPTGRNSIARIGTGASADDFTWAIQSGIHTPGALNIGQTFGASPRPQGMAIDDLLVTPLVDHDGDLLPDVEEIELGTNPSLADSDHDGQDDFFEILLGRTDPLSPRSFFQPILTREESGIHMSFPTHSDCQYQLETSADLSTWTTNRTIEGTGSLARVELPSGSSAFVRVRLFLR